jgi:hypothetical protein
MNKVKQYGMLSIALVAFFCGRTSAQCPHLPNCAECSDGVHCDTCLDPGIDGLRVDRTGCDDCYAVSGGTCYTCTTLSHCQDCFSMYHGPVSPTTKAMCATCTTPNCAICTSDHTKCDNCNPGFQLISSGQCVQSSAGCPHLVNCAECSDDVHCDVCLDPENHGLRFDRTGCDDCFEVGGGRCST